MIGMAKEGKAKQSKNWKDKEKLAYVHIAAG